MTLRSDQDFVPGDPALVTTAVHVLSSADLMLTKPLNIYHQAKRIQNRERSTTPSGLIHLRPVATAQRACCLFEGHGRLSVPQPPTGSATVRVTGSLLLPSSAWTSALAFGKTAARADP
jgi:hypothetical protein